MEDSGIEKVTAGPNVLAPCALLVCDEEEKRHVVVIMTDKQSLVEGCTWILSEQTFALAFLHLSASSHSAIEPLVG